MKLANIFKSGKEKSEIKNKSIIEEINLKEKTKLNDEDYLKRGKAKVDLKDYNGALSDFNIALNINPENAFVHFERYKVKDKLGDKTGANQDLQIASTLMDKLDAGINAYNTAVDKDNANDFKSAIEYYCKAIKLNYNVFESYYNCGICRYYNGDYNGALLDYNKGIELDSTNSEIYSQRGFVKYKKLNDFSGAIEDYNIAIRLSPNNASYYRDRGESKSKLNKFEEALQDFDKAIELNLNNAEFYFNRSICKFNMKNYTDAIYDLDTSLKLDISKSSWLTAANIYSFRGGFKCLIEDFKGAIADFTMEIKLNPSAKAYFDRADAKMNLNLYSDAINDLNKVIGLEPEKGEAYYMRGCARKELGLDELYFEDKIKAIKLGYEIE